MERSNPLLPYAEALSQSFILYGVKRVIGRFEKMMYRTGRQLILPRLEVRDACDIRRGSVLHHSGSLRP